MENKKNPELMEKINSLIKKNRSWAFIWKNLSEDERKIFQDSRDKEFVKSSLEVIDFLNKSNIKFLVLKGLTLRKFNTERRFDDLDIFVHKDDIKKTLFLLKEKFGYKSKIEELRQYKFRKGSHITVTSPTRIRIEVHYFLAHCFNHAPINPFKEKINISINNIDIPSLSPELQLTEIFLHMAFNHGFLVKYWRVYEDITTIIKNYDINWGKFIQIIFKLNIQEAVYKAVKLLYLYNQKDAGIPEQVVNRLYKDSSKFRLYLTREFNEDFLKKSESLENEFTKNKKKFSVWLIKKMIIFNLGFNKRFFKLLIKYIFVFKLDFPNILPPLEEISYRYEKNPKSISIYAYYPVYWKDMMKKFL